MNEQYEKIIAGLIKENGQVPEPINLLGKVSESNVVSHIMYKKEVLNKPSIPLKNKALILLAVGIALDAPDCILTNTKFARKSGASTEEILEVFSLAKFGKSATTIANSSKAFKWLIDNPEL